MSRINAFHVHVLGEVEDAQALMQSKAVMVVPLFSGSGMRIKVIEGMAMERAVVSTSLGVEGISAEDNVHLCIADSAGAFAEKIAQCIRNREFYDELRQNGRKFIENHFDYREVAKDVLSFYKERLKV
jgi:glycosyltransferase involved in cell wall biosynthesis